MNSYKNNFLLWTGAGIFFCTLLVYFIVLSIDPSLFNTYDKFEGFPNVIALLIFTVIIAPIIEEVIFRGIFTGRKWFTMTFFLGTFLYCLISENYYLLSLLGIAALLVWKNKAQNLFFYFINAILFALIHYKIHEFQSFYDIIPVFFQLGFGLIIIWMVLNFSLKRAMVSHIIYNGLVMGLFIVPLQFPDEKLITSQHGNVVLHYQRTPVFGNSKILSYPNDLSAERVTIKDFAKQCGIITESIKVEDSLRWDRFNFRIKTIDGRKIKADAVKALLIKEKLIKD